MTATLAVREEYERASERALVHEMLEGFGTGWGVNGLTPTLRALSRGQVRSLLVDADASEPGFRCGDSGRLALTERECRGEGEPDPGAGSWWTMQSKRRSGREWTSTWFTSLRPA